MTNSLTTLIRQQAQAAKRASDDVAHLSAERKNIYLRALATALSARKEEIIAENAKDIAAAKDKGLSNAMIDRLTLNPKRIEEMVSGIRDIINLPDPVGRVVSQWTRPNGLQVERVRIPLGVIAMIYESRPNVTIDAAALCFKSGNAIVLRGGSEAISSNIVLGGILQAVSREQGISPDWVQVVDVTDRQTIPILATQVGLIDLIIPRGGEGLMRFIDEHARVPVLKHDKGVCSIYIDDAADPRKAIDIVVNAKAQRPGVCNALENVWVHESVVTTLLPSLIAALQAKGVEVRGDETVVNAIPGVTPATPADWTTEYLDLILSIGVVRSLDDAIRRIRETSSLHTEAIVTENAAHAERFLSELNSSCVLWNASTRFNDGGQLGLGAEIGISTTKLHAFGPMGLEELTTTKFVVRGSGQVRA